MPGPATGMRRIQVRIGSQLWLVLAGAFAVGAVGCSDDAQVTTTTSPPTASATADGLQTGEADPTTTVGNTLLPVLETSLEDIPEGTIPALLAADGRFETLLELLEDYSPLQLRLLGGPAFNHTFLAPTDEAFAALSPNRLQAILDDEIRTRDLFHRHVLSGAVKSSADLTTDVRSSDGIVPVIANAGLLKFRVVDDAVLKVVLCEMRGNDCQPLPTMDEVTVIETDIEASNGLFHVLDGVMVPPD